MQVPGTWRITLPKSVEPVFWRAGRDVYKRQLFFREKGLKLPAGHDAAPDGQLSALGADGVDGVDADVQQDVYKRQALLRRNESTESIILHWKLPSGESSRMLIS